MLKQISMPTVIKTHSHDAQFIRAGLPEYVEQHEKRRTVFQERVEQAEKELDAALNEGFEIVAKYDVKTDRSEEIVFVLHKASRVANAPKVVTPANDALRNALSNFVGEWDEAVLLDAENEGIKEINVFVSLEQMRAAIAVLRTDS